MTDALTSALPLALTLGLTVLLPGLAGGAVLSSLSPELPRARGFLSRALACGICAWLLTSGALAELGALHATSSWTASAVLGALSVGVLALSRPRSALVEAAAALRHLVVPLLVTVVSSLPVLILVLRTTWGPVGSTPWYYWGLAEQVARAGGVPETSREWATATFFLDDYRLFSTGTAMLLQQVPADPALVIRVMTVLAILLLAAGSSLLATAFGAGRLLALAAIPVALSSGVGAARLVAYRPEGFALGLELLLVALCVDWLRFSHRGSLVAAVLLAPVLTQVHGIAVVCAAVLITAAALALRTGHPWRRYWRRCIVVAAGMGAGIVLLGLAFGGAAGTVHAGNLLDQGGLGDPTWEFFRAARGYPPTMPPSNLQLVVDTFVRLYYVSWWWVVPLFVLALGALVWAARRDRSARTVLVFTGLSLLGLGGLAAVFALGWDSYVPRRTGTQRILIESTLLLGPLVAWALTAVVGDRGQDGGRDRRHGAALPAGKSRLRDPAVAVAALCALGVLGAVGSVRVVGEQGSYRPPRTTQQALAGLGITEDDVVLTNAYLEGYLAQVTGTSAGLLEGRAPYTFAELLDRANRLLREAQDFYAAPRENWGFLAENDVTYVLVAARGSFVLGTRNVFESPVRRGILHRCAAFDLVLQTPDLRAYRVQTSSQAGPTGCGG